MNELQSPPEERTTLEQNDRMTFTPVKDGIEYVDGPRPPITLEQNDRMTFTPELDRQREEAAEAANPKRSIGKKIATLLRLR